MKKIIILLIFLIINISFANAINEYTIELVNEINVGDAKDELGWNQNLIEHIGGIEPQFFTINQKNLIYVCDQFNGKLNVYDITFKFIKSIKVGYGISSAKKLYIDNKERIISLSSPSGLIIVNEKGNLIFQTKYRDLPNVMKGKKEFFIFDEDVVYFDNNENIIIIDSEGKTKTELDFQKLLEKYNSRSLETDKEFLLTLKEEAQVKIEEFVKNIKIFKIDGVIYTGQFDKLKTYNDKIKELSKNQTPNTDLNIFGEVRENTLFLIDYDKNGNSYWEGRPEKKYNKGNPKQKIILICSKYGEIIDCFYNMINNSTVAIAPNGDVYFRESIPTDGKYHFYKVIRKW